MDVRLLISRLASSGTRASAARALALLCAAGFLLTLIVLAAAGRAGDLWLFMLLAWALFVYVPLRIVLEASQVFAAALRRRLGTEAERDAGRHVRRPRIELAVDTLFDRVVVMPRIATPRETGKVKDGAAAVLVRAGGDDGLLRAAARDCLAAVDAWVEALGGWAAQAAGQNIQARWGAVRALAAMAAMTKILIASHQERAAAGFIGGNGSLPEPIGFLDACLDYCDDLALEVDTTRWELPPLGLPLPDGRAEQIRETWTAYARTPSPALEARSAFVHALLSPSFRPAPPSAS